MVRSSRKRFSRSSTTFWISQKSKLGNGTRETKFALEDCIEEALGPLGIRALKKGLDLTWTTEGKIPGALKGDPTRLRQVLINLVGNAINSPNRAKSASERRARQARESRGDSVHRVGHGIGIPEKHQQIFDAFSSGQLDDSRIRRHWPRTIHFGAPCPPDGWADTTRERSGRGSKFSFTVNFDVANEEPRSYHQAADLKDKPCWWWMTTRRTAGRSKNCSSHGNETVLTTDGITGVDEYQKSVNLEETYPLVLLDVNMPQMDGYEVAARCRNRSCKRYAIVCSLRV